MRRAIATILCGALLQTACASAGGPRLQTASRRDATLMASYLTRLPIGARVRVDLVDGHRLKGTLMKVDTQSMVIQAHTRIPEPPVDVLLERVAAVELDNGSGGGVGKAIGIGVAAGAGGALATFLILVAIFAGD